MYLPLITPHIILLYSNPKFINSNGISTNSNNGLFIFLIIKEQILGLEWWKLTSPVKPKNIFKATLAKTCIVSLKLLHGWVKWVLLKNSSIIRIPIE